MQINGYEFPVTKAVTQLLENYDDDKYAPVKTKIFRSLELTSLNDVKVVILGQDPYPTPGDACGLSFSVERSEKLPKSLINIFKELKSDLNIERVNGDLSDWAKQGVLLLNTILTVEQTKANSHRKIGWQETTNSIINQVADKGNVVFVLLGKQAQAYEKLIDGRCPIINAPHPSPLSAYRGFFDSKIFSEINIELCKLDLTTINW